MIERIGQVPVARARPYLICEAGVNHEGSLSTAIEMVDAAAENGADMIKFQSYKAGMLASRDSPAYWDQSKEPAASQFELFCKYDSFNDEDYYRLYERCQEKGIAFCSTPFDAHFVDLLAPWVPAFKIASADLTNRPLLEQIASKGVPVLLSTGASTVEEIERAVGWLGAAGAQDIALLHCVLEYPCQEDHVNLLSIPFLKNRFPCLTIGYSDHVPPREDCLSLLAAWLLGADIVEKHFTLDKSLPGNDHYHAMDPDDLRAFRRKSETVGQMLGTPGREIFPWERSARKYARRSLVAAVDIPASCVIQRDQLVPKRPGTGISPSELDNVIGRRPRRDIPADTILTYEMIE